MTAPLAAREEIKTLAQKSKDLIDKQDKMFEDHKSLLTEQDRQTYRQRLLKHVGKALLIVAPGNLLVSSLINVIFDWTWFSVAVYTVVTTIIMVLISVSDWKNSQPGSLKMRLSNFQFNDPGMLSMWKMRREVADQIAVAVRQAYQVSFDPEWEAGADIANSKSFSFDVVYKGKVVSLHLTDDNVYHVLPVTEDDVDGEPDLRTAALDSTASTEADYQAYALAYMRHNGWYSGVLDDEPVENLLGEIMDPDDMVHVENLVKQADKYMTWTSSYSAYDRNKEIN